MLPRPDPTRPAKIRKIATRPGPTRPDPTWPDPAGPSDRGQLCDQQPKFLLWLFLKMFSARNDSSLDFLWLRVMTSWRVKVTSFFWEKMKKSIYAFKCSGIMKNWIKHELFHLNNEISWWHDMTHDNMSSHDICHMTSRHDFISIKFWHLTSSICRCEWTGAMISLLFHTVVRSINTF